MALIRATYFSSALAGQNTFNLVLPNDVPPFMADANPHYQRPMKTLVLLHGYNGGTDDWVAGSSIQELAVQYNLVSLCPTAETASTWTRKQPARNTPPL